MEHGAIKTSLTPRRRSPGPASWRLGPFSVRAYALCIIAGIVVAVAVASYRYRRTGGRPGVILDVAAWAVPFGLAGAFVLVTIFDITKGAEQ